MFNAAAQIQKKEEKEKSGSEIRDFLPMRFLRPHELWLGRARARAQEFNAPKE